MIRRASALVRWGVAGLFALAAARVVTAAPPGAELEAAFQSPPAAARPWVYWYWNNAAVSPEGIKADLVAMKEAGIAGAYLMPIRGAQQPPQVSPPVEQLTPAWWECVRLAFQEADRLGLKLALHDCDGFATAGGPWITPEHSMQRVVWTATQADGGGTRSILLPQPTANEGFYRDIAVLAIPAAPGAGVSSRTVVPTVTSSVAGSHPQALATADATFQSKDPCWIQYAFAEPFTCRAITVSLPPAPNAYEPNTYQANRLIVEVSDDGLHFRRITRLTPPRHGWQDGDADVTHAITPVTARFFRFGYDPADAEPGAEDLDSAKWKPVLKLRGLTLWSEPKLNEFEGKSGAVWRVAADTTDAEIPARDCVPLARVIALTERMDASGRLTWEAPAGRWTILRIGHTSTGHRNETGGRGRGLECDKFDPESVRFQFDHWFGEAVRHVGPELAGRVLKIFHVDSWECGSQNWSPVFRAEFRRRRGYDPVLFLPAMTGVPIESAAASERFLHDVRTTIAELLADNFFGTLAQLAHEHGCEFSAESVAPTMVSDGMLHHGRVDVPMGEFWLRSPTHDKLNDVLDAVSGAHVYGRRVVQAEAFTELVLSWDEAPRTLKILQDRNYATGVNRLVFHVFTENPWTDRKPGMTLSGVGLYFQRDQTWWRPGRAWIDYAARCQALLQQGHPVVDVAVFTGEEVPRRAVVPWQLASTLPGMIASPTTVMAGRKTPQIMEAGDWATPLHGYAYDSINPDALVRVARVEDGRLTVPGGGSYGVIVVPAAFPLDPGPRALSVDVAAKLRAFAQAGGALVLGHPDEAVTRGLPAGRVAVGPYAARDFTGLGLAPDVRVTDGNAAADGVTWLHRAGDGWDLYFLSNQRNESRRLSVSLRLSGRVPELWDAVTGEQRMASGWTVREGRTELSLRLPAAGSIFVVFRTPGAPGTGTVGVENGAELPVAARVDGPWQVQFAVAAGGPKEPLTFARLESWTARPEPALHGYSGTATYRTTFTLSTEHTASRVWLDLGDVREIAEIAVNGVPCGVAWTPPFRVDVTQALRPGVNDVRVAVTNTWFNRLAADHALPELERRTWTTAPDRTTGKPLLEAGLLGPVTLQVEKGSRP